jgi:hypothetical protein
MSKRTRKRIVTRVALCFLFLAAASALAASIRAGTEDPWASGLFVAMSLLFGLAVGEWWVVLACLLWFIPAAVWRGDEDDVLASLVIAGIVSVPVSAIALATGVTVRRVLFRRRRARGDRISRPSSQS